MEDLSSRTYSRRSLRKDSLRIEALVVPPLGNNVFILFEDGFDEALVIDVAQGADPILARLKELDLRAKFIINTHGHTDHTAEDEKLRLATSAKLLIHELDAYRLATEDEASEQLGIDKRPIEADLQLINNQEIKLGRNISFKVLHTPGHTEGSICLYDAERGQLFSGDTLFAGGYGRLDGRGGNRDSMIESLKSLLKLPPTTEVYPGHGSFTTIRNEEDWLKQMLSSSASS